MPAAYGPPWDIVVTAPANPAPGAAYTLTFAAGFWYHVLAADYTITTSAQVATRNAISYYLAPSGSVAGISVAQPSQAASLAYAYYLFINAVPSGLLTLNQVVFTLPDIVVPETWQFVLDFNTRQTNDQISSVMIYYERLAYV